MTPTRIALPVIPRPPPSFSDLLRLVSRRPPRVEQHDRDRPQQDLDIERQGPAAHVLDVQLAHLAVAQPAAPRHLPQARDPRLELQAIELPMVVSLELVREWRAPPHQAHRPPADVEQLGQAVERGAAHAAPAPPPPLIASPVVYPPDPP